MEYVNVVREYRIIFSDVWRSLMHHLCQVSIHTGALVYIVHMLIKLMTC